MFLKAVDGKYYENPTIFGHNWVFSVEDESCVLRRTPKAKWSTVKKAVNFPLEPISESEPSEMLVDGKIKPCILFYVQPTDLIPIPKKFDSVTK